MTYRTGNHWGVTIVRQGDPDRICCNRGDHPGHNGDELVAVVVNGDQALAERICALLNHDETPEAHRPPHPTCIDVTQLGRPPRSEWVCGAHCPPGNRKTTVANLDDLERADVRRRVADLAEHRPEIIGPDGFGYGRCAGCREVWPCTASRSEASR